MYSTLSRTDHRVSWSCLEAETRTNERIKLENDAPLFTITPQGSKATVAAWTAQDQFIVSAHENGTLNLWDMVSNLFKKS